jgi:hypothetical protein
MSAHEALNPDQFKSAPEFDGKTMDDKISDATNGLLEVAYSDDAFGHHIKPLTRAMNRLYTNSRQIQEITGAGHPLDYARGALPEMLRDAKTVKKSADAIGYPHQVEDAQALIDHIKTI